MTSARAAAGKQQARTSNNIDLVQQNTGTMVDLVKRMTPMIADALPKHMTPDRMARLAMTAIRQSEIAKATGVTQTSLADCTPESFVGAILKAAQLGLEPGTDEAWLIPYRNRKAGFVECQLIVGYKGLVKKFYELQQADFCDTGVVRERDEFHSVKGLNPVLSHTPAPGERGPVVGYWAVAKLAGKTARHEFLTVDEVAALRGSEGPNGGIRDPQHWMERKTVLKQVLKLIPMNRSMDEVVNSDDTVSGTRVWAEQIHQDVQQEQQPSGPGREELAELWRRANETLQLDATTTMAWIGDAAGHEITRLGELTGADVERVYAALDEASAPAEKIDRQTGEITTGPADPADDPWAAQQEDAPMESSRR